MTMLTLTVFALIFSLFTLVSSIVLIDNIWHDDFTFDSQGLNGWNIYYNTGSDQSYTNIPVINGSLGKYHGVYKDSFSSIHYLKRTFQCKNDSSIRLGYMVAFCGNKENDKTQVHLNTEFGFLVDFTNENRIRSFQDEKIKANYTCGTSYSWHVYYDTTLANVLQSFIAADISFEIKIEVQLSTKDDSAVINNITVFCDPPIPTTITPTSTPTRKPNVISDVYDVNATYGWEKLYIETNDDEFLYSPDKNPLIYGEYTYHGIYQVDSLTLRHILYRLFKCQHDSDIIVQYSVVYCGTYMNDFIEISFNDGIYTYSIEFKNSNEGRTFTDINVSNAGPSCEGWIYRDFMISVGSIQGMMEFQIQFKYTLSNDDEFGALYNISVRCDSIETTSSTAQPTTIMPTTKHPTTSRPTTNVPTTINPTTTVPTTTTDIPTTTIPTTFMPTTTVPTTITITTLFPMYTTAAYSAVIVSSSSSLVNTESEISISDVQGGLDIMFVFIIITTALILLVVLPICFVCYKIHKKKQASSFDKTESVSHLINMTESVITTPSAVVLGSDIDNNMLIKNKTCTPHHNDDNILQLCQQNTTDIVEDSNAQMDDNESDKSETEKMFDNTENVTTTGGFENELDTPKEPVIEGYIAKKEEDNDIDDDIYLQSDMQTTMGNDGGV